LLNVKHAPSINDYSLNERKQGQLNALEKTATEFDRKIISFLLFCSLKTKHLT